MTNITTICLWDMPSTVQIRDGYEYKTVPEPTKENMELLVNKINQLTAAVTELQEKLISAHHETANNGYDY